MWILFTFKPWYIFLLSTVHAAQLQEGNFLCFLSNYLDCTVETVFWMYAEPELSAALAALLAAHWNVISKQDLKLFLFIFYAKSK